MVKYLRKIIDKLKMFKSGMESNVATWAGQSETPASVQAKVDLLVAKEQEIVDKKEELSVLSAEARVLETETGRYSDGMENLARGLHVDTPEKLSEYGIPPAKPITPSNPPTMPLTVVLKDDTDGEGFIVSVQFSDSEANNYEWQKGVSINPGDTQTIPALSHLKLTSKMFFVDDDVVKGSRYWYRVRSINRKGVGPWSEPASIVQ